MNGRIRAGVLSVSAVLVVGSFGAFVMSGMYPYTRFRDKAIEQANAEQGFADLFAETTETQVRAPQVESVNAIGFLPSGPGLASVSVLTLSGPAVAISAGLWWWERRARRRATRTAEPARA